jgi:hypothetical protein
MYLSESLSYVAALIIKEVLLTSHSPLHIHRQTKQKISFIYVVFIFVQVLGTVWSTLIIVSEILKILFLCQAHNRFFFQLKGS